MRDPRTTGAYRAIYATVDASELYRRTGAMEIEINTLAQLFVEKRQQPWLHDVAQSLLFVPDFIAWALTGQKASELTIASTSQLIDPIRRDWANDIIRRLEFPRRIFNRLVEPGSVIGPVLPSVASSLGLPTGSTVIAVASHDTAAAAAAAPIAPDRSAAFISLGTWSLLGQELSGPNLSSAAREGNFTNECGIGGRIVFHKILLGLWLLQECHRVWRETRTNLSFADIHAAAAALPPAQWVFDVGDPRFVAPDHILDEITGWFTDRRLAAPTSMGEVARAIYDSLAFSHRRAIRTLETITGDPIDIIHIVSGGSQASILCQATADATGTSVATGPVEAAVVGNLLCQLIARRELEDINDGRDLVRRSFPITVLKPVGKTVWDQAEHRVFST
jgi:sugar (pentulose or hexulose) kinase